MSEVAEVTLVIGEGAEQITKPLGPLADIKGLVIGRAEDAPIYINHPTVSRRHLTLSHNGTGALCVMDLGSSSGTRIDGRDVPAQVERELKGRRHRLHLGDVLVEIRISRPEAPTPPVKHVSSDEQTMPRREAGNAPAVTVLQRHDGDANAGFWDKRPGDNRAKLSDVVIVLKAPSCTIGRAPECDFALTEDLLLSRTHARFRRTQGGWAVMDLGSGNGTFVNGERIRKLTPLENGDVVTVGGYQLRYSAGELSSRPRGKGVTIEVRNVAVPGRGSSLVLQHVDFTIEPGELVALLGVSGSGKTRLMHAMCGRAPIAEGQVLYDSNDFATRSESLKKSVGYVPSWLTLHDPLTVIDGLRYASRLRLGSDATPTEIDANIDRVLRIVNLSLGRDKAIKTLSDGEKRRVGLAVELLSSPPVMLLDEVTTALDLPTHCKFMRLFRELADNGQTLLLISHHLEDLEKCDKWLYLIEGRVAFFGSPQQFKDHFRVPSLRHQLEQQEQLRGQKTGEQWAREFRPAGGARRAPGTIPPPPPDHGKWRRRWTEIRRQFPLLMSRYTQLLKADIKGLGLVLGMAPLIAIVIVLLNLSLAKGVSDAQATFDTEAPKAVYASDPGKFMGDITDPLFKEKGKQQGTILLLLTVSSVLIGSFLAVREIVKETDLYRHERFAGIEVIPYILSKLVPLGTLAVIAAIVLGVMTKVAVAALSVGLAPLIISLSVIGIAAVALGLFVSSAVDSSEKAVYILIPILIAQITFIGAAAFDSTNHPISKAISQWLIVDYWANRGLCSQIEPMVTGNQSWDQHMAQDPVLNAKRSIGSEPWGFSTLMIGLHALAYCVGAYILLTIKGKPALESIRSDLASLIPRTADGKISLALLPELIKSRKQPAPNATADG